MTPDQETMLRLFAVAVGVDEGVSPQTRIMAKALAWSLEGDEPDHTHPEGYVLISQHLHDGHPGGRSQAAEQGLSPKDWHEREHEER